MSGDFSAAYWEDRYRSGVGTSRLAPSPSLVDAAAGLPPGRALDAGCGVGADAHWLAARGWQVTAVDVSATALEQGRRVAEAAGAALAERLDWVCGDLTAWEPGERFDLVTSHYVHVPGPQEVLFARLASWVAPGGTLLVVGHDAGHGHGHGHGHGRGASAEEPRPAGAEVGVGQVLSCLPEQGWHVVVAEPRTHVVERPAGGGTVTLDDVVVLARRQA